ncbi:MAG: transposase [Thermoanaerobaculia bacterium]
MARPMRLEYAGATWFVTSSAAPRREVFRDDDDRAEFLSILGRSAAMLRWKVVAYSLLRTRFHLVVETPEPNLSRGMRQINGVYTQYWNRRYGRGGALFSGRYKSLLVERDPHLVEVVRHVAWSPVADSLARGVADWKWTSYRATAGSVAAPEWLVTRPLLDSFAKTQKVAEERFRKFVAEGKSSGYEPSRHVIGQLFLGSEAFRVDAIRKAAGRGGAGRANSRVTGVERPKMRAVLLATADVFGTTEKDVRAGRRGLARKAVAFLARRDGALKLPEIGDTLGIREFSASHLATEGERLYERDAAFRKLVDKVRHKLGTD